jgi:hypothetical protein
MPVQRIFVLVATLLASVGISVLSLPRLEAGEPRKPETPEVLTPATVPKLVLANTERTALRKHFESRGIDLFSARNWQPVPDVIQVPAPSAPALPFRYLGKLLEDGTVTVFLSLGEKTYLVRKGDTVTEYKVEEVTPEAMTLVYLPLNEIQNLVFGSSN